MTKACSRCGEELPLEDFHASRSGRLGRHAMCKPCRSAHRKTTNERANQRRIRRERYATDAEYREKARSKNRVYLYGLTDEEVLAMVASQGGCAACGASEPGGKGRWHVDHDHSCCSGSRSCGKCIRGILCAGCNLALGHLKDDPQRALALANYLFAGLSSSGQPNIQAGVSRYNAARTV